VRERLDIGLSRAAIRLYEGGLKRRPIFRIWRELEASQWHDAESLEALRSARLRALLEHADRHSPWFREQWRAQGLSPAAVRTTADLVHWPVIDRETIRANRAEMRSTRPGHRLLPKATGGSSGVPLQFDLDTVSYDHRLAAWHRGYGWAGAAPGTRQWYLWGVPPAATSDWSLRKARWYDRLYRRTTTSCFSLAESEVHRFATALSRARPDAIVAYTGALHAFARMLEAHGIRPYRPASIVVGAEQLHDFQRETIERVFGAPVFETYGSREFMLIGAECEAHQGLHLTAEHLVVELLDDDDQPVPAGVEGDVVITDLTNAGLPFIRYRNGDRAIAAVGDCSCGRTLPRLARVTGRRLDILTTPEGRQLPGEFFPHILKEFSAVQRFQVEQVDPAYVTIRIVAPAWSSSDAERLEQEVAAVAGGTLEVRVEQVSDIALTGAGKLKVVVNRLMEHAGANG
jgi:phenylacetate-CoA ligase